MGLSCRKLDFLARRQIPWADWPGPCRRRPPFLLNPLRDASSRPCVHLKGRTTCSLHLHDPPLIPSSLGTHGVAIRIRSNRYEFEIGMSVVYFTLVHGRRAGSTAYVERMKNALAGGGR